MKDFKGTKGKWEVNENLEVISGSNFIADCNWLTHFDESNAKLIASAPEMFETIQDLLKELRFHGFNNNNSTAIHNANQLLTKITEL